MTTIADNLVGSTSAFRVTVDTFAMAKLIFSAITSLGSSTSANCS